MFQEFIKKDPAPTSCRDYGTGYCCHDKHFDPTQIVPTAPSPLCEMDKEATWQTDRTTTVKELVNCAECISRMHA